MFIRNIRSAFITLTLILSLAACNKNGAPAGTDAASQSSTTTADGKPDACALVTKADAEAVLGAAASAPQVTQVPGGTQCVYKTTVKQVFVEAVRNNVGYEPDYYNIDKKGAAMTANVLGKSEPVTGIGDEAYWGSGLHVLKGHVYFTIVVSGLGNQNQDAAKTLALKAVQRL